MVVDYKGIFYFVLIVCVGIWEEGNGSEGICCVGLYTELRFVEILCYLIEFVKLVFVLILNVKLVLGNWFR